MGVRSHVGKWSYTSGIVDTGESSLEGAIREVKEELGIDADEDKMQFLLSFKRKHNFVDVWLIEDDINITDLKLQQEEVSQVKYVSQSGLERIIKNGDFVPGIEIYYELFTKLLERYHIQDCKKVKESNMQNTQDEERG